MGKTVLKKTSISTLCFALACLFLTVTAQGSSTLENVRQRGFLNCGVHASLPGFSIRSPQGWNGFEVDFCRAVAAATLGDARQVRFIPLPLTQGYTELQSGDVDLLVRHNRWTMKLDTVLGLTYVAPWFYEQQGFLVQSASQIHQLKDLKGIRICVSPGNDKLGKSLGFFIQENHFPSFGIAAKAFENGQCDALSGPVSQLYITRKGFNASPAMLIIANPASTRALGPIIRQQDAQWFKIIRWTTYLLINAESAGITKLTASATADKQEPATLLAAAGLSGISLGLEENWATRVISQLGHYGEIFERNLGPYQIERDLNTTHSDGGLHLLPAIQ